MLVYVLLGLVAIVVVLLIAASIQPSQFTISRSLQIDATPQDLFPQINDLKLMYAWSPWAEMDPNSKVDYSVPSSGINAVQRWNGNGKVGEGSLQIVESQPYDFVNYKLKFIRPFKCENDVSLSLKSNAVQGQTTVTWAMVGKNNFMGKIMCLFMNMDKMVGKDFEKGLGKLKRTMENANSPLAAQP